MPWDNSLFWPVLGVLAVGAFGGVLNALAADQDTLHFPKWTRGEKVHLGYLSNILFGTGGAFAVYALVHPQVGIELYGMALVAGAGGSSFFLQFVQKQQIGLLADKNQRLEEELGKSAKRRAVTKRPRRTAGGP